MQPDYYLISVLGKDVSIIFCGPEEDVINHALSVMDECEYFENSSWTRESAKEELENDHIIVLEDDRNSDTGWFLTILNVPILEIV